MCPSSLAYFTLFLGCGAGYSEGKGPFRKALSEEIKLWTARITVTLWCGIQQGAFPLRSGEHSGQDSY